MNTMTQANKITHNPLPFEVLKQTTRFYFLRHGQSEGNKTGTVQGHLNAALSEEGRKQAQQAGAFFRAKNGNEKRAIHSMFSSPLSRAYETARTVARCIDYPESNIAQDERLQEINAGIFAGISLAEAQEQHPKEWDEFQKHSWEGVPGAERIESLLERTSSMWHSLIEHANSSAAKVGGGTKAKNSANTPAAPYNILCVSHGGTLGWLLKRSMSPNWARWIPVIRTDNCCIHCLTVYPSKTTPGSAYAEWTLINHHPSSSFVPEGSW